ncbi:hypothetical protein CR513_27981, partial [Mucuna pruriens]
MKNTDIVVKVRYMDRLTHQVPIKIGIHTKKNTCPSLVIIRGIQKMSELKYGFQIKFRTSRCCERKMYPHQVPIKIGFTQRKTLALRWLLLEASQKCLS